MEYKEIVIDNDALVNTEPRELETEPQNKPQGEKPQLNPNPGYGKSINQQFIDAIKEINDIFDEEGVFSLNIKFTAKVLVEGETEPVVCTYTKDAFAKDDYFDFICLHEQTHYHYIEVKFEEGKEPTLRFGSNFDKQGTILEFTLIPEDTDLALIPYLKNVGRHTESAIKTDLVEGERGTPIEVVTPAQERINVVREPTNFVGGLLVGGKSIQELIPEPTPSGTKLYQHTITIVSGDMSSTVSLVSTTKEEIKDNGNLGDSRFSLINVSKDEVVSIVGIDFPTFGPPPYNHIRQAIFVAIKNGYDNNGIDLEIISINSNLTLKKCDTLFNVINNITSANISSVSDTIIQL